MNFTPILSTGENMKKTIIAMSGGVDSSVAAQIVLDMGHECAGATMKLFCGDEVRKSGVEDNVKDAKSVADRLNIPFYVYDFCNDFKSDVIENFIKAYEEGATPNPCVICNKCLKFGKFLDRALEQGAEYIATGHYARIEEADGRYLLKKATDIKKDQSYVLYDMTQHQLKHTIFPLGSMTKEETRQIAEEHGFVTAGKHDSQDICFVPDGDYAGFIERYLNKNYKHGNFVDMTGKILGEHKGIIRYTIGQRKGLGLSLPAPMYVFDKDIERNEVILCSNEELFGKELDVSNVNWILWDTPPKSFKASAKIRYNQKEEPATITVLSGNRVHIEFDEPQRAIAKGQSAVFYDGDIVIGGGIIE